MVPIFWSNYKIVSTSCTGHTRTGYTTMPGCTGPDARTVMMGREVITPSIVARVDGSALLMSLDKRSIRRNSKRNHAAIAHLASQVASP